MKVKLAVSCKELITCRPGGLHCNYTRSHPFVYVSGLALALTLRICTISDKLTSGTIKSHHFSMNRLRQTAAEARELLLAKPSRENEAKLDTLLRHSLEK